jgi:hypothetical protein
VATTEGGTLMTSLVLPLALACSARKFRFILDLSTPADLKVHFPIPEELYSIGNKLPVKFWQEKSHVPRRADSPNAQTPCWHA